MSVYTNRSRCNCCPRQPNLYKEMERTMRKLNCRDDWASSKIPDYPYIYDEIETDKHAYEVCCKSRRRRTRAPSKEYLTVSQHKELVKSKSPLLDSDDRLHEIYYSPHAQRSFPANKKPKWRVEHEKRLQEEAKAEEDNYIATRWQIVQDKFQRILEQNQKRNNRLMLEKEQVLKQSKMDLNVKEKHKKKKEKTTPEHIEKGLMRTFSKIRIPKSRTKMGRVAPGEILNTPLDKFQRLLEQNQKRTIRWRLEKEQVLKQSKLDLNVKEKHKRMKERTTPEHIERGLMRTSSKIRRIRKSRTKMGTVAPGEVLNTPLDKFQRLLDQNQKRTIRWRLEKEQVLKQSRLDLNFKVKHKRMKERTTPEHIEKGLMRTFSKIRIRKSRTKMGTVAPGKVLSTPLGNYKKSHKSHNRKRNAEKSGSFDQMLKVKVPKVPQFYSIRLPFKVQRKKTTHVGAKFSWTFRRMVRAKAKSKPKMSKPFDKLIKEKDVEMPELMPALRSREKIERNSKEEKFKRAIKLFAKSRQSDESEPNYGVSTVDKSRHLPPGNIKPQISQQFHKMLRGKEHIPELNEALMSHHEITPDTKEGKAASRHRKSRPKKESEPNYGVSKTKKSEHTPTGDIKPQASQKFHKMLKGKEKIFPELNEGLMRHHEIFTEKERTQKSPSGSRRASPKIKLESTPHRELKKFDYYIRHSLPDLRIFKRRGSKGLIPYLRKRSIGSVINENSDPETVEKPENIRRSTGSIIRTSEIAKSFLYVRKKEAEDVEQRPMDDIMSDTIPEDYQPSHKQDPSLQNSLIKLIANLAKADKAKEISQSKNWLKPNGSRSSSELKNRRSSLVLKKSVHDEIKKFERVTLREYDEREQYQEPFVLEDKSVVQARIQELMKYVVIRKDFQLPKPPRDFIRENIEMLQKKRPRKIAQIKRKRKPIQINPISLEKQQFPVAPDFCKKSQGGNPNQQVSDAEHEPKLCYSSQDQQDQYHTKPKAPSETVVKEDPKCDTFYVPRSGYSKPDSDLVQKTKPQKLLRRERGDEAVTDFSKSQCRNFNEHEPMKELFYSSQDQQNQYQTKPKAPAETVARKALKCGIFYGNSKPDSNIIQKTRPTNC